MKRYLALFIITAMALSIVLPVNIVSASDASDMVYDFGLFDYCLNTYNDWGGVINSVESGTIAIRIGSRETQQLMPDFRTKRAASLTKTVSDLTERRFYIHDQGYDAIDEYVIANGLGENADYMNKGNIIETTLSDGITVEKWGFNGFQFTNRVINHDPLNDGLAIASNWYNTMDLSQYVDSAYAVYTLQIPDSYIEQLKAANPQNPLDGIYLAVGFGRAQHWDITGNGGFARENFTGVPLKDYYDIEAGGYQDIAVPLSKFDNSVGNLNCYATSDDRKLDARTALYFSDKGTENSAKYFHGMGVIREDRNDSIITGFAYDVKAMGIYKGVTAVSELKADIACEEFVSLSWNYNGSGNETFNVYRQDSDSEQATLIAAVETNSYNDANNGNGFLCDGSYKYFVEVEGKYGLISEKTDLTVKISGLGVPQSFAVALDNEGTSSLGIKLSWGEPEFGTAYGYEVYRNGQLITTLDGEQHSYRDTEIIDGEVYSYYIVAIRDDGKKSFPTEEASEMAAFIRPPENVRHSLTQDGMLIEWDSVTDAYNYVIYINGEEVSQTAQTSYVMPDVKYMKQYSLCVTARLENGAQSVKRPLDKFYYEDPAYSHSVEIFKDEAQGGFSLGMTSGAIAQIVDADAPQGSKYINCRIDLNDYVDKNISFKHNNCDVSRLRTDGNRLCFYIKADAVETLNDINVGFETATSVGYQTTFLRSCVRLADYAQQKTGWQIVRIPLSDFPDNGTASGYGHTVTSTIDYSKIKNIVWSACRTDGAKTIEFLLDRVTIDSIEGWSVSSVLVDGETAIAQTIPANTKKLNLSFSTDMDIMSLNGSTVWLKDNEGNYIDIYVEGYGNEYTINYLTALSKNTEYTLGINGAKSSDGITEQYSLTFTTDNSEPEEILYSIPDIAPIITHSTSGSTVTAEIELPHGKSIITKNTEIIIEYPFEYIVPDGKKAVTLPKAMENAVVEYEQGKILIKYQGDAQQLSGNKISVAFSIQKSGDLKIKLSGNAAIYNQCSNSENNAKVIGEHLMKVTKPSSANRPSGGGGGSVGSATLRPSNSVAATPSVTPVEPSQSDDKPVEFSDAYLYDWAIEAILTLTKEGYIKGYEDGTFKPQNFVTREEFAAMLTRLFELTDVENAQSFTDVIEDEWYYEAVSAAANAQIINGRGDGTFGVGMTITREEMCTMIYRAIENNKKVLEIKYDLADFNDKNDISDYALKGINALYQAGIINGVGDGLFLPKGEVNRAMAAKVLFECFSKLF